MQVCISSFTSEQVYKGKLNSSRCMTETGCCRFVNVSNSVEESKGHSFKQESVVIRCYLYWKLYAEDL